MNKSARYPPEVRERKATKTPGDSIYRNSIERHHYAPVGFNLGQLLIGQDGQQFIRETAIVDGSRLVHHDVGICVQLIAGVEAVTQRGCVVE